MKKKTVLISGIDGFLGSNLLRYFIDDYNIIGIEKDINNLIRINAEESKKIFLYDLSSMALINTKHNIDFIIHTATHHCKYYFRHY